MSVFALEEALEADWVAVRPHAFRERQRHKFAFIVAWNEVEGKFAITCHNRTAQRQRRGSPAAARQGPPDGEARSPLRGRGSPARRAAAEDAEGLEAGREEAAGGEECSWAGLFSFQDLRAVHQQLCSVSSDLEPCLPAFPEEPAGMWSVLFGPPALCEPEMDALCCQLQIYLGHGLDTCGWKILSQVLFTEAEDPEEYYESLSELRQKGYEEVLQRARKRIQEVRPCPALSSPFLPSALASPRPPRWPSGLCTFMVQPHGSSCHSPSPGPRGPVLTSRESGEATRLSVLF